MSKMAFSGAMARSMRLVLFGLLLHMGTAYGDTYLRPSKLELTAENPRVLVIHKHDVQLTPTSQGTVMDLNSTLRIISKGNHAEIVDEKVMPLTALVNLGGSKYFAGLSTLKTLAYEYNFILFTESGRIVTTALISRTSGHCHHVSESVTNYIGWFDESAPNVRLVVDGSLVTSVIVRNPHDRGPDATGECVISVSNTN